MSSARDLRWIGGVILLVTLSVFPWSWHGMNWTDLSWYFHFGHRWLQGEWPYRDYIFQVGFIPILVDAGFQRLFGEQFLASLGVGWLLKTTRHVLLYLIFRRFVSPLPALLAAVALAFVNMAYNWGSNWVNYNWSSHWVNLFVTLAMLLSLYGLQPGNSQRRSAILFGLVGVLLGGVLFSRQSDGVLTLGVLVAIALCHDLRYSRLTTLPILGGFGLSTLTLSLFLAMNGALMPAFQQMFLDASEKKAVGGLAAITGALTAGGSHLHTGIALLVSGGLFTCLALSPRKRLPPPWQRRLAALGMAILPTFYVLANTFFPLWLPWLPQTLGIMLCLDLPTYDLPRVFLGLLLLATLLRPAHSGQLVGINPPIIPFLLALTLAPTWSREMSFPGRGWTDITLLVPTLFILFLASRHVPSSYKRNLTALLAAGVACFFTLSVINQTMVVGGIYEGTLATTQTPANHPMLQGLRVSAAKAAALEFLRERVQPGDSCFIYGVAAPLYTLLACQNPTRLDMTVPDFYTVRDAAAVMAALEANPPQWIIHAGGRWASPSLSPEPGAFLDFGPFNPAGPQQLHTFLVEFIRRYDRIGTVGETFSPDTAPPNLGLDQPLDIVLYRYSS